MSPHRRLELSLPASSRALQPFWVRRIPLQKTMTEFTNLSVPETQSCRFVAIASGLGCQ
jgi:hypothetical protein